MKKSMWKRRKGKRRQKRRCGMKGKGRLRIKRVRRTRQGVGRNVRVCQRGPSPPPIRRRTNVSADTRTAPLHLSGQASCCPRSAPHQGGWGTDRLKTRGPAGLRPGESLTAAAAPQPPPSPLPARTHTIYVPSYLCFKYLTARSTSLNYTRKRSSVRPYGPITRIQCLYVS